MIETIEIIKGFVEDWSGLVIIILNSILLVLLMKKKERNIYWIPDRSKPFTKANENGKRKSFGIWDDKYQAFYQSKEWIKLSKKFKTYNPLCSNCLSKGFVEPVEVVDHIIPISEDYNLRLDYNNLQGLCRKCNFLKWIEDKKKVKEKKIDKTMNDLNDFD
jgi:5-methylcytosine-specific restriction endonuclease McrA